MVQAVEQALGPAFLQDIIEEGMCPEHPKPSELWHSFENWANTHGRMGALREFSDRKLYLQLASLCGDILGLEPAQQPSAISVRG